MSTHNVAGTKPAMVRIERFQSELSPVYGPRLLILPLDKVAEALTMSGFMKPWLQEKIKEHLLSGGVLQNRASGKSDDELAIVSNGSVLSMQVRSEWRLATDQELLDYVDTSEYAKATGHAASRKSQENKMELHYHEGAAIIQAYEKLPRQAQVILDILNEASRDVFTDASVTMLLVESSDRLKTKQPVDRIWAFYKRRLIDEGHLSEVGD